MSIAIVNFRTSPNGSYWLKPGQRRGWWRVLLVADPAGCTAVHSHNVECVLHEGYAGIDGVTERSAYYLGKSRAACVKLAQNYNDQRLGSAIVPGEAP